MTVSFHFTNAAVSIDSSHLAASS